MILDSDWHNFCVVCYQGKQLPLTQLYYVQYINRFDDVGWVTVQHPASEKRTSQNKLFHIRKTLSSYKVTLED